MSQRGKILVNGEERTARAKRKQKEKLRFLEDIEWSVELGTSKCTQAIKGKSHKRMMLHYSFPRQPRTFIGYKTEAFRLDSATVRRRGKEKKKETKRNCAEIKTNILTSKSDQAEAGRWRRKHKKGSLKATTTRNHSTNTATIRKQQLASGREFRVEKCFPLCWISKFG
jgi:hypothetical protein